ncbi:MAG: hypothetical protein WC841_05750 [Candidatus Shapirobacteria bacterium]|jgi:hypothetical protein
MKNNKYIFVVIAFMLLLTVLIFARYNYQFQISKKPGHPIIPPPALSERCGLQDCHGLDVTCGPDVPEVCDLMYQIGDNCRQYALCGKVSGECRLQASPKFDACKSCVQTCEQNFQNTSDPAKVFECESTCFE